MAKIKDKSILIKCNGKIKEEFKQYADETNRGMSEIIMDHIVSDIKEYKQNGRKTVKKTGTSSKAAIEREMSTLYHATNVLNILKEKGIEDKDIEREVKALWDTAT